MGSEVKLSEQFSLFRDGKDELFYIQNICNVCGWRGAQHFAYCSAQHSSCQEERQRHKCKEADDE